MSGATSPCQRGSGVWAAAGGGSWTILLQGEAALEGNPRAMQEGQIELPGHIFVQWTEADTPDE